MWFAVALIRPLPNRLHHLEQNSIEHATRTTVSLAPRPKESINGLISHTCKLQQQPRNVCGLRCNACAGSMLSLAAAAANNSC